MDDASYAALRAGAKQRKRSIDMDFAQIVTRTVLQRACAVYDCIDIIEQRKPAFWRSHACQIASPPFDIRTIAPHGTREADHLVAGSQKI
jgi:hypothetical protein